MNNPDKEMIKHTIIYILTVLFVFWATVSNHVWLAEVMGISDNVSLDLGSLASVLGILAAAAAVIISNRNEANKSRLADNEDQKKNREESRKEQQAIRDQIYQRLELESIKLFRFENDNVELARITWDSTKPYETIMMDKDEAYRVLQHVCQVLNLFEMAVRFKKVDIVHEDVFESWIAWIYDLCASSVFLHFWYLEEVRDNYIEQFQNIIDKGLVCQHGQEEVDKVIVQAEAEPETEEGKDKLAKEKLARESFYSYMKNLHLDNGKQEVHADATDASHPSH